MARREADQHSAPRPARDTYQEPFSDRAGTARDIADSVPALLKKAEANDFLNLTPGPPLFSTMNSTPADSRACSSRLPGGIMLGAAFQEGLMSIGRFPMADHEVVKVREIPWA